MERKNSNIRVRETLGGLWLTQRKQQSSNITKHFLIAFKNACEHLLTKKPLQHRDEMYSQTHNGSVLKSVFYCAASSQRRRRTGLLDVFSCSHSAST